MISQTLKDNFNVAYATVIERLFGICESWGKGDFPSDHGLALRNELFMFLHAFGSELHREDYPDGDWQKKCVPLLAVMSPSQLVRVVGILHVYACCLDYCWGKITPPQLSITLNWVSNSYECHRTYSTEWFELVTKHRDTFHQREGVEKMCYEISVIIGSDPADPQIRDSLSGLAIICQHGMDRNHIADAELCSRVFGEKQNLTG